ncbi:MAG: hypothetical protein EOO02_18160 [Chitinophagaceae bacterium]|nr:MAG: hypothetical protein EOO02_18160 [Chitinophagaceae bacterium]
MFSLKSGAKIIHITPPIFDERHSKAPGYENVLAKYSDWLMEQRPGRDWEVIDIHKPMWSFLQKKINDGDSTFALAKDGVHPAEQGHWLMAQPVLTYLGFRNCLKYESIDEAYKDQKKSADIIRLIRQRQLTNRDAWLRETKHLRPGLAEGLDLKSARDSVLKINDALNKINIQ